MALLDGLTQEVHATVGVMESALVLIDGLDKKIEELKQGLITGDQLQSELQAERVKLAEAIANDPNATP